MNRYFYYQFLVSLFINTIFFVPRLLLKERFHGAVMALPIAIVIGTVFALLFTRALRKFPGEGISEIFRRAFPGFVRIPLLLFFGVMWAISGSVILVSFSMITLRFLNPESSPTVLLLCFCGISCWAASFRPIAIMNASEFVIWANLPFVAYMMYNALSNEWFDWDSIRILSDYAGKMPTWKALAAATYPFTGYINMSVYNKVFKDTTIRHHWLIPLLGSFVLFVSFIVPIGLLGIDSVDDYLYTWITSADTLRMKYGILERVVYLFLFIYIGFCLLFITLTWNIGSLLIRECFGKQVVNVKSIRVPTNVLVCVLFAVATFVGGLVSTDKSLVQFVVQWQIVRLGAETLLVAMIAWLAWGWARKYA